MIAFQTKLKQTVNLVEKRIRDKRSEDPIKDLGFLSEHYRSRSEWDKANAATRHMLAVAEGDTNSVFEITPIDIELHESKKLLKRRAERRFWSTIIAAMFILTGMYVAIDEYENDPQFILDLRAHFFPWDPQTFVDRAGYFHGKSKPSEALRECDRALESALMDATKAVMLDNRNYRAYKVRADILTSLGRMEDAHNDLIQANLWRFGKDL